MLCPICNHDDHSTAKGVWKCPNCLRSFQLEPNAAAQKAQTPSAAERSEQPINWDTHYKDEYGILHRRSEQQEWTLEPSQQKNSDWHWVIRASDSQRLFEVYGEDAQKCVDAHNAAIKSAH